MTPPSSFKNRVHSAVRLVTAFALIGAATTPARASDEFGYYDNCDGGHAEASVPPTVTRISTTYGIQNNVQTGKVVFGNASLAYIGDNWASLPRLSTFMNDFSANQAYQQYIKNNYYYHPAHEDDGRRGMDPAHSMSPTKHLSLGSSASELGHLVWSLITFHSFSANVQARLRSTGLLMPTIQMIFRRTRVATDADYLTAAAHPSFFSPNVLNYEAMWQMARDMAEADIPPMAQLRVIQEDPDVVLGRDYFEIGLLTERIFTTPVSIARIWRAPTMNRKMIVTAEDSYDVNNRDLTYEWRVLRGDPAHVRITPRNGANSEVELDFDYHATASVTQEGRTMDSNLVVVGLFVHNGAYYSAPAFVTSYTLATEDRVADGNGRLDRINYSNPGYAHNNLSRPKSWEYDEFHYDAGGNKKGWTRKTGAALNDFTKEGYVVIDTHANGDPFHVRNVNYTFNGTTKKVDWAGTGDVFIYSDDTENPTVTITSPANGSLLAGTVAFEADANDNVGVAKVEFYVEDTLIGTDVSLPYQISWDTTAYPDGPTQIGVKAFDTSDRTATATGFVIVGNLPDTDPPTVNIFSPQNGATVGGTVQFFIQAGDNRGVSQVQMFVDDSYAGDAVSMGATQEFYSFDWDSSAVADGDHVVKAVAKDAANNTNEHSILITVDNGGNTAPAPDAGVDQTITLPATATLAGSVTDDGLPDPPGQLLTYWEKFSGPGLVTFDDPALLNATAAFSQPGVYVVRLNASDGSFIVFDDVTITVNPDPNANNRPTANAGADQTVTLPAAAALNGSFSDDGLPNPPGLITITWSKESGPGTVTFEDANAAVTNAHFSQEGTYVLKLRADDGALFAEDDVVIAVNALEVPNQPPAVEAGPNLFVTLPDDAHLNATVTDDGLPNPPGQLNLTWTDVSGPATVQFADRHSAVTTAAFTAPGTYVLRLTASDGVDPQQDELTVTVFPPAQSPENGIKTRDIYFNPEKGPAAFEFNSSKAGTAKILIYTRFGEKVQEINADVTTGGNRILWNGSIGGRLIATGIYGVRISAPDGRIELKLAVRH